MEGVIRSALFFMILSLAAVSDMRKRIIPDWMPLVMAGISLIPPGTVHLTGLLAALPLFVAGMTAGGIGGGDIKLAGACGLVLGFERTLAGLIMALFLLIMFHAAGKCSGKWAGTAWGTEMSRRDMVMGSGSGGGT